MTRDFCATGGATPTVTPFRAATAGGGDRSARGPGDGRFGRRGGSDDGAASDRSGGRLRGAETGGASSASSNITWTSSPPLSRSETITVGGACPARGKNPVSGRAGAGRISRPPRPPRDQTSPDCSVGRSRQEHPDASGSGCPGCSSASRAGMPDRPSPAPATGLPAKPAMVGTEASRGGPAGPAGAPSGARPLSERNRDIFMRLDPAGTGRYLPSGCPRGQSRIPPHRPVTRGHDVRRRESFRAAPRTRAGIERSASPGRTVFRDTGPSGPCIVGALTIPFRQQKERFG